MSPQPASLLPPPACAVAHPMVVKLFTETDAGDQLTDAQDEQRHARPAGRSRSARVMRVAAPDRDRPGPRCGSAPRAGWAGDWFTTHGRQWPAWARAVAREAAVPSWRSPPGALARTGSPGARPRRELH